MTQRHNEDIERCMDELERYGLRGEVSERGKHLEVAWTTPHGRRFVIAPKTPSDWRSGLNLRSDLRKLLRADGMQPKQISELTFQKAMTLPKAPAIAREQVLQNDVDALTDLVFDLQTQISMIQQQSQMLLDRMNSARVVSRVEFGVVNGINEDIVDVINEIADQAPVEEIPFRKSSQQYKVCACLTDQFKFTNVIVKESGVPGRYVSTTLWKAKQRGYAESGLTGQWRRKQQ